MEIAMAKSEGILGPLTKVEVVISPENTKTHLQVLRSRYAFTN